MSKARVIAGAGGVLGLAAVAVLILWSRIPQGHEVEEAAAGAEPVPAAEAAAEPQGARLELGPAPANPVELPALEGGLEEPARADLVDVVLQVVSPEGGSLQGCRVTAQGLTSPRWTLAMESAVDGTVRFPWPADRALLVKVWPDAAGLSGPPVARRILTPTREIHCFVVEAPGFASLTATLSSPDLALPDRVFVAIEEPAASNRFTMGGDDYFALFREDALALRVPWSGWTELVGHQVVVDRLPPGEYRVRFASDAGFASVPAALGGVVVLSENETTDLGQVTLSDGGQRVRLRIEDRESEHPVAGARIEAVPVGVADPGRVDFLGLESDADGQVDIPLLSSDWRLRVMREGYSSLDFSCALLSAERVNRLSLERPAELVVRLAGDYLGLPDPDVGVFQRGRFLSAARSDANEFRLVDLAPGPAGIFFASGGRLLASLTIALAPGSNDFGLGEARGRLVKGVARHGSQPVTAGFVVLEGKDAEGRKTLQAQALRNGAFAFPVADGAVPKTLRLVPGGSWQDPDGYFTFPLAAEQPDGMPIEIELPSGAIRIRAGSADTGEPAVAKVQVRRDPVTVMWGGMHGRMCFELPLDHTGAAVLPNLPAGDYELSWTGSEGRTTARCSLAEGGVSELTVE